MKKILLFIAAMATIAMSSCSDMLEVESDRFLQNPDINKKTDSLFYAFGIMQAMQQAADMYVLQNEMRGDILKPTQYANESLSALHNFSATAANKYDSAYVYYKVINNCNYYLAHRDTTLRDGAFDVTRQEYAAVLAFRAWAYLQAARQYGKVPFFTEPLEKISQINNNSFPVLGITDIVAQLTPLMEKYSGEQVPSFGFIECGSSNDGTTKSIASKYCFIPIDIMLGDMYLEVGGSQDNYLKAAQYYYKYLYANQMVMVPYATKFQSWLFNASQVLPSNFAPMTFVSYDWNTNTVGTRTISLIPMSVNKMQGKTTALPELFGYDYYSTDKGDKNKYMEDKIQIVPTEQYKQLVDSSWYYYTKYPSDGLDTDRYRFKGGDQRYYSRLKNVERNDSVQVCIKAYEEGNIVLYRTSTVWLHLAEALNRAGYPDAAFAILKDGIKDDLITTETGYISDETKTLLTTTIPFLNEEGQTIWTDARGIHAYGCADAKGLAGTYSMYQFPLVVGEKMAELKEAFPELQFAVNDGSEDQILACKQDSINAVEDLLCDEYALELAFEGTRFSDLTRMARHKNETALHQGYPANFGGKWLAYKLRNNNPVVSLEQEANWYLPFK
ncbi:MAG: RagB/SusD family nutrient uptake outer membrane protein [Prevotella sp.]|nr:RagB/SusD family nutrient uptake outer membrane protein [Prevotella sp.]